MRGRLRERGHFHGHLARRGQVARRGRVRPTLGPRPVRRLGCCSFITVSSRHKHIWGLLKLGPVSESQADVLRA